MTQPLFVRSPTHAERVGVARARRKLRCIDAVLRAHAVVLPRQQRTVWEIDDIVARNRSTVYRWLRAFNERVRTRCIRARAPRALPKADGDYQVTLIEALKLIPWDLRYASARWVAPVLVEHLYRKTHVKVSSTTMYNLPRRVGYR